jgi:predicted Zn-dependent protease
VRAKTIVSGLLISAAIALTGCQKVPYTNRERAILVPWETELQLGADAYKEALAAEKVVTAGPAAETVGRVGKRVSQRTPSRWRSLDWEYKLLDSETVNAFCLPGGKIAVYSGILPVMGSEAGMAAVLGHEAGHAVAQHGAERISGSMALEVGLGVASIALGGAGADPALHDQLMGLLGLGATVGVILPFSRANELEADYIGGVLMSKAGYEPREAVGVWTRMTELYGDNPIAFLSTHPSNSKRIQRLEEDMPGFQKYYKASKSKYGKGVDLGGMSIPAAPAEPAPGKKPTDSTTAPGKKPTDSVTPPSDSAAPESDAAPQRLRRKSPNTPPPSSGGSLRAE